MATGLDETAIAIIADRVRLKAWGELLVSMISLRMLKQYQCASPTRISYTQYLCQPAISFSLITPSLPWYSGSIDRYINELRKEEEERLFPEQRNSNSSQQIVPHPPNKYFIIPPLALLFPFATLPSPTHTPPIHVRVRHHRHRLLFPSSPPCNCISPEPSTCPPYPE